MAEIYNDKSNTLLSGTSGDDSIQNGWWDDYWHNGGSNVTINGGTGNDYIYNYKGTNVTIDGGAGNDSVDNRGSSVTINTGAGNDYVWNDYNGSSVTINTGEGNDYVWNDYNGSSMTINTGEGNDSVYNWNGDKVTINTGAGNDEVLNLGSKVTIDTGDGKDSVHNYGDKVTINSGEGNDYVVNEGSSVTINTGAGNDSVHNGYGSSVTITGGKGNDYIYNNCYRQSDGSIYYYDDYNRGANILFKYASGDGNDIIYGFRADSTLSIGGGSYSTKKSGDNIIVTVGDGKISLVGAASLEAVNIKFKKTSTETNSWKLSGTTATYGTSSNTLITISGVKSLDGISLSGKVVTVAASALNKSKVTISDGYTLKLADDVSKTAATYNSWSYKNSIATLSQTKGAYYSLASDGKSISYSAGTSSTLATVSGVKSLDGISLNGKVVTVAANALNQTAVTISDGYTLKLADDVSTTATTSNSWSYKSSVATLKQTKGAYYSIANDGKTISYSAGTSKTLATVSGVKSADGLSVKKKVITVAQAALNQSKVTLSGSGYKLKLGSDVSTTATTSNSWSYKNSVAMLKQTKGAYYSLASNGKSISYSAGTSKTLATVSGVKSASGLSVKKKVITVAQAALNQSKVTLSGSGYKLKLASDVSTTAATSNAWSYKNSVATLKQTKGAYYSLASNGKSISYSKGTSKTLATIKGAKSTSGLKLSGNKITLKNSALNKKVTVSGGYEFDFASDYKKAAITGSSKADTITSRGNNISITGGKSNDVINLANAAKNNLIVYKSGDGKDIINGLTEDDTIKIASGAAHVSTSGADVIFTVGKGSITVKDAAEKNFIYIADGVKETYSAVAAEPYTISGAEIVLSTSYSQNDFNVADYGEELETIDASAVNHALNITGNYNDNKLSAVQKMIRLTATAATIP